MVNESSDTLNQTLTLGGPEFMTFEQMTKIIMSVTRMERTVVPVGIPYLRIAASMLEGMLPRSPITTRWLDHLAVNRITELVSVTRYFGLKPARFEQAISYMVGKNWGAETRNFIWGR